MTASPDNQPLFPTTYTRPAPNAWRPSGIELLPEGWVNVRLWSYDRVRGVSLWVSDPCPGVLHEESAITETG